MRNLFISLVLFLICTSFQIESGLEDKLIGCWIPFDRHDSRSVYKKVKAFLNDSPGVEFRKDGILRMRQNSGWCGTPPIHYTNYEGTWQIADSTIIMKYKDWEGERKLIWEFVRASSTSLEVEIYGAVLKK